MIITYCGYVNPHLHSSPTVRAATWSTAFSGLKQTFNPNWIDSNVTYIATGVDMLTVSNSMELFVLGAAYGIGGQDGLTSCFQLDDDILFDAGTGISSLKLEQLLKIKHVFLTHSHLDHIAGLGLLIDAIYGKRAEPVRVYASDVVIQSLREYLFNWKIWPDYSTLPNTKHPFLEYIPMTPHVVCTLGDRKIHCSFVQHVEGSLAYLVSNKKSGFAYCGECNDAGLVWHAMNKFPEIKTVLINCSFPSNQEDEAKKSRLFTPRTLIQHSDNLSQQIDFCVYLPQTGYEEEILTELQTTSPRYYRLLQRGQVLKFS